MSYKVTFFGVPAATPIGELLTTSVELARELSSENGFREAYLSTTADDIARRVGFRPLYFAAI